MTGRRRGRASANFVSGQGSSKAVKGRGSGKIMNVPLRLVGNRFVKERGVTASERRHVKDKKKDQLGENIPWVPHGSWPGDIMEDENDVGDDNIVEDDVGEFEDHMEQNGNYHTAITLSQHSVPHSAPFADDDDFEAGFIPVPVHFEGGRRTVKRDQHVPCSDGSYNVDEVEPGAREKNKRRPRNDTSWLVTTPIEGGPVDGTVIPSFNGHVAAEIWNGNLRGVLKCYSREKTCKSLQEVFLKLSSPVQDRIQSTGLAHLPRIMFDHLDMPLISAFVERWQPDTNSFHMPFGEMTIMLHDVHRILDIPIDGSIVGDIGSLESLQMGCDELFGVDLETFVRDEWQSGSLSAKKLLARCLSSEQSENYQFICYMMTLLGSTLFIEKTGERVRAHVLSFISDSSVSKWSWGSATLAYLYRQLGIASRAGGRGMAGCCTLLQCWIYEYFPQFRPSRAMKLHTGLPGRAAGWDSHAGGKGIGRVDLLESYRLTLDTLEKEQVNWLAYGEHVGTDVMRTLYYGTIRHLDIIEPYMPDRALGQLGYIQPVPLDIITPDSAHRPRQCLMYNVTYSSSAQRQSWTNFPDMSSINIARYDIATIFGTSLPAYKEWFELHSHLLIVNRDLQPNGPHLETVINCRTNTDLILGLMMRRLDAFVGQDLNTLEVDDIRPVISSLMEMHRLYRRTRSPEGLWSWY